MEKESGRNDATVSSHMRIAPLVWSFLASASLAHDPTGVVVAPNGRIYVADPYRCRIFEVTPEGEVTHFAGSAAGKGSVDGPRLEACFGDPHGLACAPDGTFYVADYSTGRVRRIGLDGKVVTLAGSVDGFRDGPGAQALFDGINGIAADGKGNVFVADARNHRIRRVDGAGVVSTLAGGEQGFWDGRGAEAKFSLPIGLALGPEGVLYVADSGNRAVRRVGPDGTVISLPTGIEGPSTASQPGHSAFVEPWAVAVLRRGGVLDDGVRVADAGEGRVILAGLGGFGATPSPRPIDSPPKTGPPPRRGRLPLDRPCGLAFDDKGVFYILDHFTGPALVLSRISTDGELTTLVNFEGQPGGR